MEQGEGEGEEEKGRGHHYRKITPSETLVDQEGWKISLLKGMYAVGLPTLIKAIWLKGSRFTYVAKKLMSLVVLIEHGIQMNWVAIMFNIQLQIFVCIDKT